MTFEPFDPDKFWQDHFDAYERKKTKLDTFEPGDRVTKPWFTGFPGGPIIEGVMTGIFIEAVPPISCKVKWDNEDEVDDDCPISFIKHA